VTVLCCLRNLRPLCRGHSNISAVVAKVVNANRLRLLEDAIIVTQADRMAWQDCWHSDWYSFGNIAADSRQHAHSVWFPLVDVPARSRGGSIQLCKRQDVPANCTAVDYDTERLAEGLEGDAASWCEQKMNESCEIPEFSAGEEALNKMISLHMIADLLHIIKTRWILPPQGDAVVFTSTMIHRTQVRGNTLIHSYTHTLIHSYSHTLIHSYTRTLIHSCTHTHSYTHTLIHSYTIRSGSLTLISSAMLLLDGLWLRARGTSRVRRLT
jgi:hypothetical protein